MVKELIATTTKNEKTTRFLKVLFLSNRTLLSKIFTLVVLKLFFFIFLFELISESNKVISWSIFFTDIFKQEFTLNSN